MKSADLVIGNARLVTPGGIVEGAAAVRGGRFVAIGTEDSLPAADARIDARGRLVLPGLVDPHVHLGGASPYEQNLVTECQSAAAGGVTTLLQYRRSPTSFFETFPGDLAANQRKMGLDTAFHFIISSLEQAEGIPEYAERWGVRSYKLYMGGYAPGNPIGLVPVDDGVLFRAMELIRELGPYAHCMVHAENQGLYLFLSDRAHRSGRLDLGAYAMSHPAFIEEEAVARIAWLGELQRCPVYVVHTTTGAAIESAAAARRRGARVVIETCPHYLALTIDDARLAGQGPAIGKVSPPLRDALERERLWTAIERGDIDLIGTDHVPILKTGATVWEERPGFAGLATMLPVLVTFGLLRGRLTPTRLAELTALHPARIFGLAPRKGAIAVGADADAVIVDLEREAPVGPDVTHSRYTSAFEGLPLRGWPVMTLRRGEIVFADGEVRVRPGTGEVLRPGAYDDERVGSVA
ncbi:MAG TPA: amidohydrolase family protein [Candidatus Limnocylindria bacterium]|nr:amidohydrolase family protein [Candidatus Limnocylindria bacterium]